VGHGGQSFAPHKKRSRYGWGSFLANNKEGHEGKKRYRQTEKLDELNFREEASLGVSNRRAESKERNRGIEKKKKNKRVRGGGKGKNRVMGTCRESR